MRPLAGNGVSVFLQLVIGLFSFVSFLLFGQYGSVSG